MKTYDLMLSRIIVADVEFLEFVICKELSETMLTMVEREQLLREVQIRFQELGCGRIPKGLIRKMIKYNPQMVAGRVGLPTKGLLEAKELIETPCAHYNSHVVMCAPFFDHLKQKHPKLVLSVLGKSTILKDLGLTKIGMMSISGFSNMAWGNRKYTPAQVRKILASGQQK